jgi:RimJ/RimL family protein N-acetyltransferase
MRHSLQIDGFGLRLRPVRMDDAEFIVLLRNSSHARGNIGDSPSEAMEQERWLARYFDREDDYYFIVETMGEIRVGTVSLYNIENVCAEIGRWVLLPELRGGMPSLILAIDLAFGQMRLRVLKSAIVDGNHRSESVFRWVGFEYVATEQGGRVIGGKPVDLQHYRLHADRWLEVREGLMAQAKQREIWIREWAQRNVANEKIGIVRPIATGRHP